MELLSVQIDLCFAINDEAHKGLLKIGDTTIQSDASIDALFPNCKVLNQAALSRIKQYTNTAGISAQLLHTELAVRLVKGKDGQQVLKAFRDHDVHRVLENSGIPKKKLKIPPAENGSRSICPPS